VILNLALAFLLPSFAPAQTARPLVLIYDGPGACKGCPAEIRSLAERAGYTARLIKPSEITPAQLSLASAYIQPGGDNTMEVRRAVGSKGLAALKDYVVGGGKYLGICLGGTLASTGPDDDGQMLGLLPVKAHESGDVNPRIVPVEIEGEGQRAVFVQDPPWFTLIDRTDKSIKVIARYSDRRIAGVSGPSGKGHVVLFGPHFEAGPDWAAQYGLKDPDGHDQSVFLKALRGLVPVKSCTACATPQTAR